MSIYVIVYNHPPLVLANDAEYTAKALKALHPRIKVLLHPTDLIPGIWSHHEKLVVIDQKVALLGGLDLCYGRYDSSLHPINNNSE